MSERKSASEGGLSIQTLLISAASAVIATLVVSQFWESGTLFFTALVPVTVAIVSEILKRPAEKITEVAPLVAPRVVPLLKPDRTEVREPEERGHRDGPSEVGPEPPPTPRASEDDPFGLYTPDRPSLLSGRTIRIGLITGLLAFLLAAAFVTASELALFDSSIGNKNRRTTLVGGTSKSADRDTRERQKSTPTEEEPGATPTAAPDEAETPEPGASPTPTPSASPAATATPSPAAPKATPAAPGGTESP